MWRSAPLHLRVFIGSPGDVEEERAQAIRILTDYLPGTDQMVTRLDVIYGYVWVRPEWACVVPDAI